MAKGKTKKKKVANPPWKKYLPYVEKDIEVYMKMTGMLNGMRLFGSDGEENRREVDRSQQQV